MNKQNLLAEQALAMMRETSDSLFLTWKAGTWKSTLLQEFVENSWGKRVIKLAPTWVSALHIGWVTIHRFFGFPIDITEEKINDGEFYMKRENRMMLAASDTIVIDEISMVRADMFDVINLMCQTILHSEEPFGGKQLVMIWDLFQLPPIFREQERGAFTDKYASEFFFSSKSYQELNPTTIELRKVYRQTEKEFITILNKIRLWAHNFDTLDYLNNACIDSFDELPTRTVVVTSTKNTAQMLNMQMLQAIGNDELHNEAKVKGKFPQTMFPNEHMLTYKVGAQVMMIKNNKDWLRYNWSIWIITDVLEDTDWTENIIVSIDGVDHAVTQEPRDVHEPRYNEEEKSIEYRTIGTFTQYPFKLGRAITIHKSQWLTFENVCIDLGRGAFVQGQTYVALSRAKSYDWIFLNRPINECDIIIDNRVIHFVWKATVPQNVEFLKDAVNSKKKVSFLYLDVKTDRVDYYEHVVAFSVMQEERKWTEFMVFTGLLEWWEKKKFSVRKMFEVE